MLKPNPQPIDMDDPKALLIEATQTLLLRKHFTSADRLLDETGLDKDEKFRIYVAAQVAAFGYAYVTHQR